MFTVMFMPSRTIVQSSCIESYQDVLDEPVKTEFSGQVLMNQIPKYALLVCAKLSFIGVEVKCFSTQLGYVGVVYFCWIKNNGSCAKKLSYFLFCYSSNVNFIF